MAIQSAYPPDDQLFALRTVATYVLRAAKAQLDELVISEGGRSLTIADLRALTRINSQKTIGAEQMGLSRESLRHAIARHRVSFPLYLQRVIDAAGLNPQIRDDFPSFIDRAGLLRAGQTGEVLEELLSRYAGCWRVFRISTESDTAHAGINRAFLNIKPRDALSHEGKVIGEFSIHQRTDANAEPGIRDTRHVRKITGLVALSDGDFVTLLGERSSLGRMGYVGLLTWRYHSDYPRQPLFSGLSILPNSEGRQIASYFVASFLEGSDQLDGPSFDALRDQERDQVGTTQWKKLRPTLSEAEREKLDALIQVSARQLVFWDV